MVMRGSLALDLQYAVDARDDLWEQGGQVALELGGGQVAEGFDEAVVATGSGTFTDRHPDPRESPASLTATSAPLTDPLAESVPERPPDLGAIPPVCWSY